MSSTCIEVGLYEYPTFERLPAFDGQGRRIGSPSIARVKLVPQQPASYTIAHPLAANLDDKVTLIGYDLDRANVRPGERLSLTLYWSVQQPLDADYQVFIHLTGADGRSAGQGDGPPLDGSYPTSFWAPGETLRDAHTFAVAPDAAPGTYRVEVGLYRLDTLTPMPVLGDGGAVEAGTIVVGP